MRSLALLALSALLATADVPITGLGDPALASFDSLMVQFLREHGAPGASLAVARNGRLVYARGFGWASTEAQEAVEPSALFRIASVSKPVTSVAILRLVEEGRLALAARVFDLLDLGAILVASDSTGFDPRWRTVTVHDLLHHAGGWDRNVSFDPMFRSIKFAENFGLAPPAGPDTIIRNMLRIPLDFDPGTKSAYSNFGFCLLGRVIERVTGQTYEDYVRGEVLAPLGIEAMRIGRTLPEGRAAGEVRYFDSKAKTGKNVFDPAGGPAVPAPYGAWYLEAMDSHGGWIASAPDLVRLAVSLDDSAGVRVLSQESVDKLFARPDGPLGVDSEGRPRNSWYACGFSVRTSGRGLNTWHNGLLAGTSTLLVRRSDGLAWAVLFNSQANAAGSTLAGLIDGQIHKAADAVQEWPDRDLFTKPDGR